MIALMLMACVLGTAGGTAEIEVAARPSPVYYEEFPTARSLNFDILIRNTTAADVDLDEIKLSVYDAGDALVLRRLVDGNGTRPSIETADLGPIAPGRHYLVFNPFHQFDRDVDLGRLVYDFKWSGKGGAYTSRLVVRPLRWRGKTSGAIDTGEIIESR